MVVATGQAATACCGVVMGDTLSISVVPMLAQACPPQCIAIFDALLAEWAP